MKPGQLPKPDSAEIHVKHEGDNPTGSMKDRMALAMIEGAEKRGDLAEGGTVIEYSTGSEGAGLPVLEHSGTK